MKVNIENCVNQLGSDDGHDDGRLYTVREMIENLKELRDRTADGDLGAIDEFFNLYVFNGDVMPYARAQDQRIQDAIDVLGWDPLTDKPELLRLLMAAAEKVLEGESTAAELIDVDLRMKGLQSRSQATAAAVAMLRNYLEKVAEHHYYEEIQELLKVTEPQECLKMWEDTQERLAKAEAKVAQYMQATKEKAEEVARRGEDVEALLHVLRCIYKADEDDEVLCGRAKGTKEYRARSLLARWNLSGKDKN